MQESRAREIAEPTPIFGAYRRGYDPEQVDRYVADQQRRLDDAQFRASEAERKLAAAVGQLRELHRRVGALEQGQQRPAQALRLDGVGEHIQRIFEEARAGAESLRETTEAELAEFRQRTIDEARSIVAGARKKAEEIELETDRRRREELQRLDEDRSHAATQLTYLHEQRKNAVAELLRIREVIDSTIAEVSADLKPGTSTRRARPSADERPVPRIEPRRAMAHTDETEAKDPYALPLPEADEIDQLLGVEALDLGDTRGAQTARLVRAHRERIASSARAKAAHQRAVSAATARPSLAVFDYEAE
jgi:hypothetical protein